MENEELLPKPLTDLPLPEKELSAHSGSASQGETLRSYRKFLILGIVLVILISIVGGVYMLGRNSVFKELNPSNPAIPPKSPVVYEGSPTPDPTANWKTYTGNGFSFKYPSDWTKNGDAVSMPADPSCPNCAPGPGDVGTTVYDNPNSLSLYDFLADPKHTLGYTGPYKKDFHKLNLPNISDALLNPSALGAYDIQEEAVLNSGKTVVYIGCTSRTCTDDKNFEKILSTFKFTNNYVSKTANWKTYTNINGGNYSIEYPPTWHYAAGGDINQGNESVAFGPNVTTSNEAQNNPFWIKMQKPDQNTGIIDPKSYANSIKGDFKIVHDEYSFNGINAYQVLSSEPYLNVIIFQRNNIIYSIWYGQNLSTDDQTNINTSLKTLTFTK